MPAFGESMIDAADDAADGAAAELTEMLRKHAIRTGIKPSQAAYLVMERNEHGLVPGFLPDTPDEAKGAVQDMETGGLATTPTAFLRRFDRRYKDVAVKLIEHRLLLNLDAVI